MLNNWRAFGELGIAAATCPGNMHYLVLADCNIHDTDMGELIKLGRRPHGRISIANSDSGGDAYANVAIDQAWRAINELGD